MTQLSGEKWDFNNPKASRFASAGINTQIKLTPLLSTHKTTVCCFQFGCLDHLWCGPSHPQPLPSFCCSLTGLLFSSCPTVGGTEGSMGGREQSPDIFLVWGPHPPSSPRNLPGAEAHPAVPSWEDLAGSLCSNHTRSPNIWT